MSDVKRTRLTDAGIARLRPREREYTLWDSRVAGLGVRVRPGGGKSFVLMHMSGGCNRRVSLGQTASKTIDTARHECLLRKAETTATSNQEPKTSVPLFADFVAGQWHAAHFEHYKLSTRRSARHVLATQLLPRFGSTRLDRISRAQVENWFAGYSRTAPGGANRALSVLRQILNFAIACGHMEANPCRGIRFNRRTPLTRFLSLDEVRRLTLALDAASRRGPSQRSQADIIRLLLLTGSRSSEILNLRWSEVQNGMLMLADSKTGPRTVHLNPQAREVVDRQPRGDSPFVFPSQDNPERPRCADLSLWRTLRREAGIEDVRLHDLRHTFASHAVMNGVPVPVVSRLLGHSSVQMTLRYAHIGDQDIRAAAERIGEAMDRLMTA